MKKGKFLIDEFAALVERISATFPGFFGGGRNILFLQDAQYVDELDICYKEGRQTAPAN